MAKGESGNPGKRQAAGGVRRRTGQKKATKSSAKRSRSLEPRQERSRESERKLIKAAAEVLGQHGVDGTTIPRIAAHAGLTPGAIYRRFSDKDALLEAVILGILERQDQHLKTGPSAETVGQIPLPIFAEQLVHSLLVSYRANAALFQAIRKFAQESRNNDFRRKVGRLETRSFERLVDMILASATEITHPEPRVAASLGLMMVISTLLELLLQGSDTRAWKAVVPQDDATLKRELTRAFLSYLGMRTPPSVAKPPVR
jgi:AcrR family transcriptional regulator